ncbi:MAG TPA: ABC transporter permease [Opitutaceae bacterium]|jgi:ribose transport system permease protein
MSLLRGAWLRSGAFARPFIGLLLVVLLGILLSPRDAHGGLIFLSAGNLSDVLLQQGEIGIIALAMTLVIIAGGIDLSVGSVLAFGASLAGVLLVRWAPGIPAAAQVVATVAAVVAAGALLGAVNGVVIANLRLQPFVMTLAAMIGVRGLTRWMTGNTNIDFGFDAAPSARFSDLLSGKPFILSAWAALAVAAHLLLTRTVLGRHLRAIGESEKAAAFTGLPIRAERTFTYVACGAAAAFAGLIHAARSHQGNPNDGVAYELDAIAAVVIGGTSLSGGQGTIIGTVTGTLVLGVLTNVLRLHMVDSNVELMAKAVIIIVAVWLQGRGRGAISP